MEIPSWAWALLSILVLPYLGVLIAIDRRLLKVEMAMTQALEALKVVLDRINS